MNKESQIVEEMLQNISELGVVNGYAGEEDVEPIFDFITDVDLDGNRVLFSDYLKTRLELLLASHRSLILGEVEKCVPAEDNPEIPQPDLTGHRSGVKKGWNLCRQATLQALETLKV